MKILITILLFFGLSNVYAQSGEFSSSTVCDYNKSEINSNNTTIIAIYFDCISTVIKSNSDLFKVGDNSFVEILANIKKSPAGMDLQSYNTSVSSKNSDDKIFSENVRKAGDVQKGGTGTSKIVGGTGKYAGINGNCDYSVSYLPKNKISTMQSCSFKK
tara:strand:+ start:74 stop:550 length:477 start_codon:yes stop_codon:yes gene_type:complete